MQSEPYFKGNPAVWLNYTYYKDGRTESKYFDGNINKITFTYDKNIVTQTMINTGQFHTEVFDVSGKIINATDPDGTINYYYFSSENPKSISAPGSNIQFEYDKYGYQKKLIDPDLGTVDFEYNAYGELVYQKDANGNWFRITKSDAAGRPLIKTFSNGEITKYTYDTDFKGSLCKIEKNNNSYSEYLHNALGQIITQKESIEGSLYITSFDYNQLGEITQLTYPSLFGVKYYYNENGYLNQIKRADNGTNLWTAGDVNARGQWKNFTLGTAINRNFTYNTYGTISSISTGSIQSLAYSFNVETGNLTWRKDVLKNLQENFTYDDLDRLTSWKVNDSTWYLNYKTDATGRIENKSDAGNYSYNRTPGIHAVTSVTNDLGIIPGKNCEINYTAFNKIDSIFETNSFKLKYIYAADEQRRICKLYNNNNIQIAKTIYVPGGYEIVESGGIIRRMHYIPLGDAWALFVKNSGGQDTLYYLLTDHLGSVNVITDANGNKLKEYSFDPWGRRRNPTTWKYGNTPKPSVTSRGFTMHEHLDFYNLINMNGRVYDPVLGQFLSPDPFLQASGTTNNFNRYSYCAGNPLKYIDPSGYVMFKNTPQQPHPNSEYGGRYMLEDPYVLQPYNNFSSSIFNSAWNAYINAASDGLFIPFQEFRDMYEDAILQSGFSKKVTVNYVEERLDATLNIATTSGAPPFITLTYLNYTKTEYSYTYYFAEPELANSEGEENPQWYMLADRFNYTCIFIETIGRLCNSQIPIPGGGMPYIGKIGWGLQMIKSADEIYRARSGETQIDIHKSSWDFMVATSGTFFGFGGYIGSLNYLFIDKTVGIYSYTGAFNKAIENYSKTGDPSYLRSWKR